MLTESWTNDQIVSALENVIPLYLVRDGGGLASKYGLKRYPWVVFTDPDGKLVETVTNWHPLAILQNIRDVLKKYGQLVWAESLKKAQETAREDGKPILYFWATDKPESRLLDEILSSKEFKDLRAKFVFVKGRIKYGDPETRKWKLEDSSQPVILVIDQVLVKPEEKPPLAKIVGRKTAKELRKELEAVLKQIEEEEKRRDADDGE